MRQVIALLSGVKGKLKHLHAWIPGISYQLQYAFCQITQVLRNNVYFSQFLLHCFKQFNPRSLLPLSKLCGLIPVRDCIIFIKSAEMIYTDNII